MAIARICADEKALAAISFTSKSLPTITRPGGTRRRLTEDITKQGYKIRGNDLKSLSRLAKKAEELPAEDFRVALERVHLVKRERHDGCPFRRSPMQCPTEKPRYRHEMERVTPERSCTKPLLS